MAQDMGSVGSGNTNIALMPSAKSQLGLCEYIRTKSQEMFTEFSLRTRFEAIDRVYQREIDRTKEQERAKYANKAGDADRIQNITVPVVMPQVKAAVTYQASVFLSGTPIFGIAAPPAYIDAGLMMESIIEQEQVEAGWVRNLLLFFVDGFKYNYSAVEVDWKTVQVASLSTNVLAGRSAEVTKTSWAGNFIERLDPYNTFHDPSVASAEVPWAAEYAGYHKMYTRARFKKFLTDLQYKINIHKAYEAPVQDSYFGDINSRYYVPKINPASHAELLGIANSGAMDWHRWMELADTRKQSKFEYRSQYLVTTMYARITPSEFGLSVPQPNTPQIFKMILVNGTVLLHIERMTNAHDLIPILFGVPLEDGLSFEDKSLAENAEPFQSVSTSLMNGMMAGRRRAVNDRIIYDPSKLPTHLMEKAGVARVPCRPSAYGTDLRTAFAQIPYDDTQAGIAMQEIQTVLALGNEVSGQNKARQGQFVKGNKTQREFDTVMANANGRDQVTAILLEDQVFSCMKKIIKINILQYHGAATIFSQSQGQAVEIDPDMMRNAVMEFKVSDGLSPTDKLMDSESFAVALQTFQAAPAIAQAYNIAPLFNYLMKQRGADLRPFEKSGEQLAYEQALAAWQQAVQQAALTLSKANPGVDPAELAKQLPPQPLPEQYGYNPQGTQATSTPQARQTQNVNNITNNITNNRQ